jgi:hypothetical protein
VFAIYERVVFSNAACEEKVEIRLDNAGKYGYTFNPSLPMKRCSLKI